jgi:uncharacterized protein (DUF1501 family)
MCPGGQPIKSAENWQSAFLPGAMQGTYVDSQHTAVDKLIENIRSPHASPETQRKQLDLLRTLNEAHRQQRLDPRLEARIESFELAFRMQAQAPEAFNVDDESAATKALYGIGEGMTDIFGRQCLMAARLAERGVRMVQVYHTTTAKRSSCQLWDQHGSLREELANNCAATDKPVAGLLKDLKSRGLLDDTLVVWGGEFGRTPTAEGTNGREHHPFGFTMFLAGGGIRGGITHGATDDYGWYAVKDKVHVHDLHATLLHQMGLVHEKLTYRYSGRDYRLTDVSGRVVTEILA